MAAPTVRGFGTATNGADAAPAFAVGQPASVATGDLLLAFAVCDTTTTAWTASPGNGWVQLSDEVQGSTHRLAVYAVIADGSDTLSIASANNQDYSTVMVAITTGTHGVTNVSTDIVIPAAATSTTGNANPPASGTVASKDWRAFAVCGVDFTASGDSVSAAPTNYTTGAVLTKSAASATSVGLGVGHRALTAATSEDPGTFTNTSQPWIAKTLLVPPFNPDATATPAVISTSFALPAATATGGGGGGGGGTIGYNVIAGTSATTDANWNNEATVGATYRYTATTGDTVTQIAVYGEGTGDGGIAEVGIYTYSGGVPVTKVNSASVAVAASLGWHTQSVSWALTNGVVYVAALDYEVAAGGTDEWIIRYDSPGGTLASTTTVSAPLPSTWVQDSTSGSVTSFYATVTGFGGGGDGTATPAVITTAAALPAATPLAGSVPSPAVITTAAALPAPATGGGTITTPAAITVAPALPAPVPLAGYTTTPAVITTAVALPAPTTGAGGGGGGGTIGYTTHGSSTDTTGDNWLNEAIVGSAQRYTASSGDTVTSVSVWGGGDGTAEVGVYTYVGGVPVTKVNSTTITIGTAVQEWSTTGLSWSLSAGTVYVVAIDWTSSLGAVWTMYYDDPGGGATNTSIGTGQTALPSTWTVDSTGSGMGSVWATVTGTGGAGGTATPAVLTAAVALPAVTATGAGGSTAAPAAIPVAVEFPGTAALDQTVSPAATSSAFTLPAPTPQASKTTTPAVITTAAALPAPTKSGGGNATPARTLVTVTVPAASATGAATGTATPAVITMPVTLPAATSLAGSTAVPAATVVVVNLPAATGSGASSGTATPAVIPATVTIPAAAASGAAPGTASPNVITTTVTMPAVTTRYGWAATPAALTVTFALPQTAAGGSKTATPSVVPVTVSVPSAATQAGNQGTPNVIAVVTVMPSATPIYGNTVNPAAIALAVTVGAVQAFNQPPDPHPVTVEVHDAGHTITVRSSGHTASIRELR